MSCDIRICSDNAIFGQPEVGLGIIPGFGGTQRLSRIVGVGMAKQMIYTGQNIKAEEALRIGLVNAVYPQAELLNEAKKLAKTISKNKSNAVRNSKKAINEGLQVDIDKGIEIEQKLFGDYFETTEQIEGMKHFLEKGKKNKKPEEKVKKEKYEMPKGELILTDKFKNMKHLKEVTTPNMPAILTSGDKEHYNSMVIGWGSVGYFWQKPIFTVYVKSERYTYEFLEKYNIFTVSIVSKQMYPKFSVYGVKSGRNINKEEVSDTHIKFLDDGGITFDEAEEVYVCKIVGRAHLTNDDVAPEINEFYELASKKFAHIIKQSTVPHSLYMGEIIGHYKRSLK